MEKTSELLEKIGLAFLLIGGEVGVTCFTLYFYIVALPQMEDPMMVRFLMSFVLGAFFLAAQIWIVAGVLCFIKERRKRAQAQAQEGKKVALMNPKK